MKFFKWTGIITGILLLLFIALHIWINYTAKHIVQDLVESRSNGRLKMKIQKFRFSWFSKRVDLTNAVIYSTDSIHPVTAYRFHVQHVKLSVQEILPILLDKKLLIDSLNLDQPDFTVTRLKPLPDKDSAAKKQVSIPEELGKIYNSIQEALQTFRINRFQINDARFTLVNKLQPAQEPMRISNIHFHIDNLSVGNNRKGEKEKLLFSDNVVLSSRNQDIVFPDNRHRLSFRNFRINLKEQQVEFDSCTITAEQKETGRSRFRVFVDTLRLSRIDFDTLYRTEVIKADSVLCLNPRFDLEVENNRRLPGEKKKGPRLEEIVQQLTGDLLLGTVLVRNADFHINTNTGDQQASFNFTNNSFELQGLKVSRLAAKPLTVKNVALAIRNYENFIRDSTYKLSFDSILIREDRVYLDHFVFDKFAAGTLSSRFSIPRFELTGLSWDDLVFNQQLRAREATLYDPVINYNAAVAPAGSKGKKSIFTTLGNIGQLIQLDKMNIRHGRIDIELKNNNAVQLEDASMTISTRTLFKARKARALEPAVDRLNFRKGIIRAGNLVIGLADVIYNGHQNGFLLASKVRVTDQQKEMDITAINAAVDDILVDEETGDITANGIRWDTASVELQLPAQPEKKSGTPSIELKDLRGGETRIAITQGERKINTLLHTIQADEIKKEPGQVLQLLHPAVQGEQLLYTDKTQSLRVGRYQVEDSLPSTLEQVTYSSISNGTFQFRAPLITGNVAIGSALANTIRLDTVLVQSPQVQLDLSDNPRKQKWPDLQIGQLRLLQPRIELRSPGTGKGATFNWDGYAKKNNYLLLKNCFSQPAGKLQVGSMELHMDHFSYQSPGKKQFNAGDGEVEAVVEELTYDKAADEPAEWSARIRQLAARQFTVDSLGRKKGRLQLDEARLNQLQISDQTLTDPYRLTAANKLFRLENFSGNYIDPVKQFSWKNAGYSQESGYCTVDSFQYTPTPELDSFLARLTFQKDYISTGCAAVVIGPIDRTSFIQDSVFRIGKIRIGQTWFTDYKDKRQPFAAGAIRPLPVELISRIPVGIAVDTVQLQQASVLYTEFSEKTNKAATIPVTRMQIELLHVKNRFIKKGDSLYISATGYVMDSIWTRLKVQAAYRDSLSGFRMTLRAKAGDIRVLNPVLIPLVSVKLNSGELDTLSLRATGREYLTLGELKMYYRNLSIRFLKAGKDERQAFLTRLKSFMANSFVIRKNNKSRTGDVFALRKRDRSAINYLLRIVISGMGSSTGAKSNKKMIRRYRQELRQKGLPAFDR